MKKFFFLLLSISYVFSTYGQKAASRIDFVIKGLENKSITVGYYLGGRQFISDTVKFDKAANAFIQKKEKMAEGVYFIKFPNEKYFDIVIGKEQYFTIIGDTADLLGHLIIEGSDETAIFQKYQVKVRENTKQKELLQAKFKMASNDTARIYRMQLKNLDTALVQYRSKLIKQYPGTFLSLYLNMMNEPERLSLKRVQGVKPGKEMFLERYQYTVSHYFDNINLKDERILRTPILQEKVTFYFNRFIKHNADSIIPAIDSVLSKCTTNGEVYRFILNTLTSRYRVTRTPDDEKIFVHLADKYYLNGAAPWADQRYLNMLQKKVDLLRPSLENAFAPDLELETPDAKQLTLYSLLKDWTILYFWDAECSKCQAATMELQNLYKNNKNKGLKVVAVYTHADKAQWEKAIKQNKLDWDNVYDPRLKSNFTSKYKVQSTPWLVLINKEKRIVVKSGMVKEIADKINSGDVKKHDFKSHPKKEDHQQ